MSSELNFVRQQGFHEASAGSCAYQFPALMLQPRIIGVLVLIGIVLQSWGFFLVLSLVLCGAWPCRASVRSTRSTIWPWHDREDFRP